MRNKVEMMVGSNKIDRSPRRNFFQKQTGRPEDSHLQAVPKRAIPPSENRARALLRETELLVSGSFAN